MQMQLAQRLYRSLGSRLVRPTRIVSQPTGQCRFYYKENERFVLSKTKPSYNKHRTREEWLSLTVDFVKFEENPTNPLLAAANPVERLQLLEETIRWCTMDQALNVKIALATLKIVENVTKQFSGCSEEMEQSEEVQHWYRGAVPRANHVLNAVLDNWRKTLVETKSPQLPTPEEVVDMLMTWQQLEEPTIIPDRRAYSIIMQASVQDVTRASETPELCEKLLSHMLETGVIPDVVAVTTAINAWAKSERPDAADRAYALFRQCSEFYEDGVIRDRPNVITYNSLLEALISTRKREYVEKADEILKTEMIPARTMNSFSFQLVLSGWSQLEGDVKAIGDRALDVLNEVVVLNESRSDPDRIPLSCELFSSVLSFFARSGDYEQAEKLYFLILELSKVYPEMKPDYRILRSMCIVYSKMNRPEDAQEMLYQVEELALQHKDLTLLPNPSHYRDVMEAWMRSSNENAVERAEAILRHTVNIAIQASHYHILPKRSDYELIFKSYARDGESAKKAEELLDIMKKAYESSGNTSVRPRKYHYQLVMQSLQNSRDADAVDRMEALLKEIIETHERDGGEELRPTRFHYHYLITALTKTGRQETARRSVQLLNNAIQNAKLGNWEARPDLPMYGAVMKALSVSGEAEEAEALFRRMAEDRSSGRDAVLPTTYFVNMVLRAWVRSKSLNASFRANQFIDFVESLRRSNGLDIGLDHRSRDILKSFRR